MNSVGTEKAVPASDVIGGVGTLNVTGTNAYGSPYEGRLTVTKGDNDVYQFAWETGTNFVGTGVRMGKYLAWNQAKRHMRKFNGVPRGNFPLFLKECEWRFNNPKPHLQLSQLKQWVKDETG